MLEGAYRVLLGRRSECRRVLGTGIADPSGRRRIDGQEVRKELEAKGIVVRGASSRELAEEAPYAYKDVDRVVEVVEQAGLARKVARLVPLGVVKG